MKTTIELCKEAGLSLLSFEGVTYVSPELERLVALVRADERAAPVQEPLEYWNAVEGWVKIDELREHFDSVGCGTIYKAAGEGRVPLTAAQPAPVQEPVAMLFGSLPVYDTTPPAAQRQWVGLSDEEYVHITDTVFHQGRGLVAYYLAIEAKLKELNT
jgi:hypothetical protein